MSQKFAVLFVAPGQNHTEFAITHAEDVVGAFEAAAVALMDEGLGEAHLVAAFSEQDLEGLLAKLRS